MLERVERAWHSGPVNLVIGSVVWAAIYAIMAAPYVIAGAVPVAFVVWLAWAVVG